MSREHGWYNPFPNEWFICGLFMFYPHYQWVSSLYALTVRHGLDVAPGLEDWPLGFSEPQRMAYRLVTTQESESPTGHRIPKTYPRHTQDIQVQKVPSVALTHELREGDPGHATCEIDRSSLGKNVDLIQYN